MFYFPQVRTELEARSLDGRSKSEGHKANKSGAIGRQLWDLLFFLAFLEPLVVSFHAVYGSSSCCVLMACRMRSHEHSRVFQKGRITQKPELPSCYPQETFRKEH